MIRAIGNKRVSLSHEEFAAYNEIIKTVDKTEFNGIFTSDKNGFITAVLPPSNEKISMVVVYFLFNIMLNQRVRNMDVLIKRLDKLEKEITSLKES